jgi:superfamily II RNA helicase
MAEVDYVVMDEFHFYSDVDRGMAWQIPLITVPHAKFLLMSATLGDMSAFETGLRSFTGTEVVQVRSDHRPVPLDWEWRETPLHETIFDLTSKGRAPIYVVSFTQREAAEMAQDLLSVNLCTREEKDALAAATATVRFDSVYGPDVKKLIRHGIGIHHAGILPKYRTLVERLAQRGLLKIIAGTDTLGVGVNVPIRTVLFTKLCKFDGSKTRILSVRDFKQIAGRAGRKGYDNQGWVLAQAPEHVIENLRLEAKAGKKKFVRKQPPARGFVPWERATFERLRNGEPEPLQSRFEITHGMLLTVLQRDPDPQRRDGGYRRIVEMIGNSYERSASRSRHRKTAAQMLRELRAAGIVELVPNVHKGRPALRVSELLQADFSLHHTLSLYLVDVLAGLEPESPTFALDVLSVVEAILESPQVVLLRQLDKVKEELIGRLKAEGVEYEERMAELEKADYPKPLAELLYATYDEFRTRHPWVASQNVAPKSIVRDMVERGLGFSGYVKEYGLQRVEGVLLRYLTQAYKALAQNVPDGMKDDALHDLEAWLFATVSRVDDTLLREWERMLAVSRGEVPATVLRAGEDEPLRSPTGAPDPAADPKRFVARIRADMHAIVSAIAAGEVDEILAMIRPEPDDAWTTERLESAIRPYFAEHQWLDTSLRARRGHLTDVHTTAPRRWLVRHTLLDAEGDTPWMIEAEVDLSDPADYDGPLLRLRRISP